MKQNLKTDELQFVNMCKAIGNPLRYEIIQFLTEHAECITYDIVRYFPKAQSTISQHLKILKESGWINGTIEGTATCYCLNKENINWFKQKAQECVKIPVIPGKC